jgi:hypothetical protein
MSRVFAFATVLVLTVLMAGTASADPTPQPGPSLNPPQTPGFSEDARQRVVIGVIVVVLLAIVWYGRRIRKKRQKAA